MFENRNVQVVHNHLKKTRVILKIHIIYRQKKQFLQRFQLNSLHRKLKNLCLFVWFLSPATVGVIAYIGVCRDQWPTYVNIDQWNGLDL